MKDFIIDKQLIRPGEDKQINLSIASLPSRTKIDIPVFVSRSKREGPTLLLLGGVHGDEINGIEILRRFLVQDYNRPEKGSVITIPLLNIYGFLLLDRTLPDGKDINRSFPGSIRGSLASRVAHKLVTEILPYVDFGLDFHTGGASRTNHPQIRCDINKEKALELAKAFNAPFTINAPLRPKSLRAYAQQKKNIPILVFEGGESLRYDEPAITEATNGIQRVMTYLEMRTFEVIKNKPTRFIQKMSWVRASVSGLFHPLVLPGQFVDKGMIVGTVSDTYGEFERKLKATTSGYCIGLNNSPIVNQGDAVVNIGVERLV